MLLLPFLILFITAFLILLLRRGHLRSHWFIASFGVLLTWVAIYSLGNQLPLDLEFSIWEPETLFSTPLLFSLDNITWPLGLTSLAIILVAVLTFPSRDGVIQVYERITSIIYVCLALAAILAGNMLSVATTWMLLDAYIFILGMRGKNHDDRSPKFIRWFAKSLISIFLLLIASVLNVSEGGSLHFREQMADLSVIILIFSALLRMPIYSISDSGRKIGWRDAGNLSTLDIFMSMSGFSVLGHVLENGIPSGTVLWVRLIGGFCLLYGLLQSLLWAKSKKPRMILYIAIFGIGLLAASYSSSLGGIILSATGVLIAFLSMTLGYLPIYENWHIVIPIFFIGMLAGLPGTPGGVIGSRTVYQIIHPGAIGVALLVWFGMAFLSGTLLYGAIHHLQDWENTEQLTKISYAMGLLFLVINAVIIGVRSSNDITIQDLLFFLSVGLMALLVTYGMTRLRGKQIEKLVEKLSIPQIKHLPDPLKMFGGFLRNILFGVSEIFEGDTGMLWAFVILLLIVLSLR